MNSTVVKNIDTKLSVLFCKFGNYIRSEKVRSITRKHPNDFVRIFKFPWYDVLLYLIFRTEKCTQSELSKYYSSIGKSNLRISKQAAFKALKKVRPEVFKDLNHNLAKFFYESDLVKTYKGYILLAEDGTTNELHPTKKALDNFGFVGNQYIRNEDEAQKATCRSAALYDITNGLVVDFSMNPFKKAEIPIAFDHINNSHFIFEGRNVIYMTDRNYGSVELFSILESYGFNYCIRGKSNFFKKYIALMKTNDEWIEVKVDKAWIKRLKYDQAKERFMKNPILRIRVVKHTYTYMDVQGKQHHSELIYFTNLSENKFSTQDIINLYLQRWDIECSYKTLKTDYEWERFNSEDCDCEMCCIYAKIIFHSLIGIIHKELNSLLDQDPNNEKNKHKYTVNIVQLSTMLRQNNLCSILRSSNTKSMKRLVELVLKLIHKIKVPIRPGRHNLRWGRVVTVSNSFRYKLDGRNYPKVICKNGLLMTSRP